MKILPSDSDTWVKFGAMCLGAAMEAHCADSIKWRDGDGDVFCVHRENGGRAKIRCVVCTGEFDGDADRNSQCPYCGSRDLELV